MCVNDYKRGSALTDPRHCRESTIVNESSALPKLATQVNILISRTDPAVTLQHIVHPAGSDLGKDLKKKIHL